MSGADARPPTLKVWDLPTRAFHWLLVASIAIAFLSSEEDFGLADWHQAAGWVAGVLIVFRVVWGLVGGEHARFGDFVRPDRIGGHIQGLIQRRPSSELGHNPLGGLAVLGLLALVPERSRPASCCCRVATTSCTRRWPTDCWP